jgi:hypothetical protein
MDNEARRATEWHSRSTGRLTGSNGTPPWVVVADGPCPPPVEPVEVADSELQLVPTRTPAAMATRTTL